METINASTAGRTWRLIVTLKVFSFCCFITAETFAYILTISEADKTFEQ